MSSIHIFCPLFTDRVSTMLLNGWRIIIIFLARLTSISSFQ